MKKHILLSIRPKYVQEIIEGTKLFEFRKILTDTSKDDISNRVIIYCSSPKMKIVGSFSIARHLKSDFDCLMNDINATESYRKRISNYFPKKDVCHALEISDLTIYTKPLSLSYLRAQYPGFCPGQSYRFLDPRIVDDIKIKNGVI